MHLSRFNLGGSVTANMAKTKAVSSSHAPAVYGAEVVLERKERDKVEGLFAIFEIPGTLL